MIRVVVFADESGADHTQNGIMSKESEWKGR